FQAEDGIRDRNVTGVQTCALPICGVAHLLRDPAAQPPPRRGAVRQQAAAEAHLPYPRTQRSYAAFAGVRKAGGPAGCFLSGGDRSEERRVGRECIRRVSETAGEQK